MNIFRKKPENLNISLSTGIVMKEPLRMETSSWLKNCMVKSILVFSIIFGALGCFLSSYDIEFMVIPTAVVLFAMALLFTSIYYRGWIMDLAYIIFFFIFVALIRMLEIYVNSGFYLIINTVLKEIEQYFDLPGMQYYEIKADNELLSTTLVIIFIGTVAMIVANVIISRTMNVWFMLVMTGWLWVFPMYFRLEPDAFYVVLMMTGYIAMWTIRSSGAYGMDRKHRDYKWKDKYEKKKKAIHRDSKLSNEEKNREINKLNQKRNGLGFWYVQDAATILETLALVFVAVLLLYGMTSMIENKNTFTYRFNQNPYKEASEQDIQEIATKGTSIFNRYSSTGGISGGKLGGVNSVNPDYQTDLVVTFAPYSYEPVYLKAFTGVDYDSQESLWTNTVSYDVMNEEEQDIYFQRMISSSISYLNEESRNYPLEADVLKEEYSHSAGQNVSRAIMLVKNVGASEDYVYAPYYTGSRYADDVMQGSDLNSMRLESGIRVTRGNNDIQYDQIGNLMQGNFPNGMVAEYEYYPLTDESVLEGSTAGRMNRDQAERMYMQIPEECRDAVANACMEAGITDGDSDEVIVAKVQSYLETEFNYTTRPGRTPKDTDFISQFLNRKKGYCAHFASAATMMLRYSGVPARYIEGYVITFDDMVTGELNDAYAYSSFYQGYNPLGETGVIDVEVSDARAHAWVEYYDNRIGWHQLEVTTAAVDPEENQDDSFWDIFGSDGESEIGTGLGENLNFKTVDLNLDNLKGIWLLLIAVLTILLVVSILRRGYKKYKEYRTWHTEDIEENIVAYYHLISEVLRRKEPAYRECPTYRSQLTYMKKHCKEFAWDADQIADILEKANYSRSRISEFDCKRIMIELSDIEKKVKKWKKYRM